jgi:hypothetical protein
MRFNDGKIIHIHIPRTSGSYIEDELCKKYNIKKKWPDANISNLFGLLKVNDGNFLTLQHLTLTEMIKYNFISNNENKLFIFTIIRNPYDRFLSIYNLYFSKKYTIDSFLSKLIDLNLENYHHCGIITGNENFNANNMLTNIENIKYFLLPQYYYIINDFNYEVKLIKYEELESLNKLLEIKLKFKENKEKKIIILTDFQKDKIYNIYKVDFDHFGYSK